MSSSISRPPMFSHSLVRSPDGDQSQQKLNGFRGSASASAATVTLTIKCPASTGSRAPILMLTDLYAVASTAGAVLTVTSSAGTMTPYSFTLTAASLVMNATTPFPGESGEDLIFTITGAGAFCNVFAGGFAINAT